MALNTDTEGSRRETPEQINKRFGIAQDGKPSQEQLAAQSELRHIIALAGGFMNENIADGREKSLALTHLEEALMWAGKAIFA